VAHCVSTPNGLCAASRADGISPTRNHSEVGRAPQSERNMRGPSLDPWTWTDERERAAQMVADGQRTNDQIAVECGVAGRSLRDNRV
jgi:hypothetical protein